MTDTKEKIMNFLKERGGRAKTMTAFFVSGCRMYSEFSKVVSELESEGKLQKNGKYGEYLEVK